MKAGSRWKILLAEDDDFIQKAYSAGFKQAGFDVVVASDGEEALTKIADEKPDIILLDLVMPKKNGFEVLKEVKSDDALKNIPVLVLTNLGQDTDVAECKRLGAEDYILKLDTSLFQLIEIVKKYL